MNIVQSNTNFKNYYHSRGIKGDDVVFCIVDSGVNEREWLTGKVTGDVDVDVIGHGTIVAGLTIEFCPHATIRSFSNYRKSITTTIEHLEKILIEAKQHPEKQYVVNLSIIFKLSENDSRTILFEKAINALVANNIPVVVAAGNDGAEAIGKYPAHFKAPICVTALQPSGDRAYFSSFDKESDLCEIGIGVSGVHFQGGISPSNNGTSLSSPIVAGKLGLIMSDFKRDHGRWPTEKVAYNLLVSMATDLGDNGRDQYYGYGFIELPCKNIEIPFVQKANLKFGWELSQLNSISSIVIHHSGSDKDTINSIHDKIISNGGLGCPFNYVIDNNGTVNVGRGLCYEGGHLNNRDSNNLNMSSIGICLIGDMNAHAPSTAQIAACKQIISYLVLLRNTGIYGIPVAVDNIYGHNTVPYYIDGKLTNKPYPKDISGKHMPMCEFSELLTSPVEPAPIPEQEVPSQAWPEEDSPSNSKYPKFGNYSGSTWANVRAGSGTAFDVIGKISKDEDCIVLSVEDSWSEVVLYTQNHIVRGWVASKYIKEK